MIKWSIIFDASVDVHADAQCKRTLRECYTLQNLVISSPFHNEIYSYRETCSYGWMYQYNCVDIHANLPNLGI